MTCLDFIESCESPRRELMLSLHELLCSFPGVVAKLRYKIPFYDRNRWLCYLNPLKDGGVELGLCQANLLSNTQGFLDFRGRTQVAGLTFQRLHDVPPEALLEIIQEAILVDDELQTKRRKSKK